MADTTEALRFIASTSHGRQEKYDKSRPTPKFSPRVGGKTFRHASPPGFYLIGTPEYPPPMR
jgi:hypothetical protein